MAAIALQMQFTESKIVNKSVKAIALGYPKTRAGKWLRKT